MYYFCLGIYPIVDILGITFDFNYKHKLEKVQGYQLETRDKRQETRDKRQETRDKRQETRDKRLGARADKLEFVFGI